MLKKSFCILCFCVMFWLFAQSQPGNPTLNIDVELPNGKLIKSTLIDSLSKRYNLHFSYNPQLLNANQTIQLNEERHLLYEVLELLIDGTTLTYKAFNNQIVLFEKDALAQELKSTKFIVLTGSVSEAGQSTPIAYCNISLVGKSLGTMSNQNGQFAVKIPVTYQTDTIGFSALGYETYYLPLNNVCSESINVELDKKTYRLRSIDVIKYDPYHLLEKVDEHLNKNYENEYSLYTTFYREITKENTEYTDISEAVLQIIKAPYYDETRPDHVKFIKGRKAAKEQPLNDIQFKLKGGPYYITKLDVVKNRESFMNKELRHLYSFNFEQNTSIENRQTAVISFKPIYNLRDVLFEGKLYIDTETWGIARVEFQYTRQGLNAAHGSLILREPKKHKVQPTELSYVIQYKYINEKWYLLSARSSFYLSINNRDKREKTRFHSVAELLTTNIEKGDFQKFSHREIFRPNEIFTDKIISYDRTFWENYNTIKPEEELEKALKNLDDQNLMIIYRN